MKKRLQHWFSHDWSMWDVTYRFETVDAVSMERRCFYCGIIQKRLVA